MTWTIPPETVYECKRDDVSVVVWAIQRALNSVGGADLAQDGHFGHRTEAAVKAFQIDKGLFIDGVFGGKSSAAMAVALEVHVTGAIPVGLVRGVVEHESSALIGSVGRAVAGGVDCSYVQRRVLDSQLSDDLAVKRAWNGPYQFGLLASRLRNRHDVYLGRPGARTHEAAWRCAALYHNYPSGADTISAYGIQGLSQYWYAPQSWVTALGVKFPDGADVRTPLNWACHYALGDSDHNDPGQVAKYVTDWNP